MDDRIFLATAEQLEAAFPLRPARKGRNPMTGAEISVPATRVPSDEALDALPHVRLDEAIASQLSSVTPDGDEPHTEVRDPFEAEGGSGVFAFPAALLTELAGRWPELAAAMAALGEARGAGYYVTIEPR